MYKKIILFLLPFLFLLFIPNVNATYYCAGTTLCLQYNQSYNLSVTPGTGSPYPILDTNDTANKYPSNFFLWKFGGTNQNQIWVFNSTWDNTATITLSANTYNYGGTWYNNSGTEELTGGTSQVGTDYYRYWLNNGTYITQVALDESEESASDWSPFYPEYIIFFDTDHNQIDIRNATDLSLYAYCSLSTNPEPAGMRGSNTQEDYIFYIDRSTKRIYIYDINLCSNLGYLDLSTLLGLTSYDIPISMVTNYDDSKMWIGSRKQDGINYFNYIYEFEMDLAHTLSTIIISSPVDGDVFTEYNIVIEGSLGAYYTGDLNCSIDNIPFYDATYTAGLYTLNIPSGTLSLGDHNVTCNFTDVYGFQFSSGSVDFSIQSGAYTNIGGQVGEFMANLLGFETDAYSTSSAKGLFLISIIVSLLVGAVMTSLIVKYGDGEGAGSVFIIVFIGMILMFAFVGWFPAWIFYIFFIVAIVITAGFLFTNIRGG